MPVWLAVYGYGLALPSALSPVVWHAHEMLFGFAGAAVAGFLLTTIPNWTGRMPLQGTPLGTLVFLWAMGRLGVLFSAAIGAKAAAGADLAFPAIFCGVIAREIVAGRNWRNLPMLGALLLLLAGNALVHIAALGIAPSAELGNRIGIATLAMLISLVGGKIIPSFTRNWLLKNRPETVQPATARRFDAAVLLVTALALVLWTVAPDTKWGAGMLLLSGCATIIRLARWRGMHATREPLLLILHIGYGWLGLGLLLIGGNGILEIMPPAGALHALTVGSIGTMTLAVMTRTSLSQTGRYPAAGPVTKAIYVLITLAAILRILSGPAGQWSLALLTGAAAAWTAAFGLFTVFYGAVLAGPRSRGQRPI
jgi:uncharacterized protein involved in response to NO